MEEAQLRDAAKAWDEVDVEQVRDVAWSSIAYLRESLARRFTASGFPSVADLLARRIPERHRELVGAAIVCGDMTGERTFFEPQETVRFVEVDGFDLSAASLARYEPKGIRFNAHVTDCNDLVLAKNRYDLVVASDGLHHVYNLGNVFYQVHQALSERGLFFMYEWVGPEYLQIPLANHIVATLLLYLLFPARSSRTTHTGRVKGFWVQEPPCIFDVSEACNSRELRPQFEKYFEPLRLLEHGGLVYPMFEGIAPRIDMTKRSVRLRVALVLAIERLLTRLRLIKPLFLTALAEKKRLRLNSAADAPYAFRVGLPARFGAKLGAIFRRLRSPFA